MKYFSLILIFFLTTGQSFAQKYLITKSDEAIPIKKVKVKGDVVNYNTVTSEKSSFPRSEIVGVYEMGKFKDAIFYLVDDQFIKREIEGAVNVYLKSEYTTRYVQANEAIPFLSNTYYIEKDGKSELILRPNDQESSTKKYLPIMKEYLKDDEKSMAELNKASYVHINDFLTVIVNYNLRKYEPKPLPDNVEYGKVVIYRNGSGQNNKAVKVKIDGETHELNANDRITLEVRTDDLSQLCIEHNYISVCKLISGSSHFYKYYMVDGQEGTMPQLIRGDKETMEEVTTQ